MPARSALYLAHVDEAGDVLANREITVTRADGAPLGAPLYDVPSGGAPVVAPETDSTGSEVLYADYVGRVKVSYEDTPTVYDDAFWPDPADVLLDGASASQPFTFEDTLAVNGQLSATDGLTVTGPSVLGAPSTSGYAVEMQNTDAGGSRALRVKDASGNDFLWARRGSGGNMCLAINQPDTDTLNTQTLYVYKAFTSGPGYVVSDVIIDSSAPAPSDVGAVRGVARQLTSGSTQIRGGEFHALRGAGAGANATWGIEVGCHTEVDGLSPSYNTGASVRASHTGWLAGTGVRCDTALYVDGEDGWKHLLYYVDTDGSTVLFDIDQTGDVYAGDVHPRGTDTYTLGDAGHHWHLAFINQILMNAGVAAAPSLGFMTETDTGLFLAGAGANSLGLSTAGVEALRIAPTGEVDYRRGQNVGNGGGAAATNATIGGSGPVTATAAGWLRSKVNGTNIFQPYWI